MNARALRPAETSATLVRLAPDGERLAYVVDDAVLVASPGAPGVILGAAEEGFRVHDVGWSPDGARVAWATRRADADGIVWRTRFSVTGGASPEASVTAAPCRPPAPAIAGNAFAWTPQGRALLVADSAAGALLRVPVGDDGGTVERIAPLFDDGHPRFPPRIAVCSDGTRIAWSCRRVDDRICEVWTLTRGGQPKLLTQIPGSQAHVAPFWSPSGTTLGVRVVHLELDKTAIVVVPRLEGEGVIVHVEPVASADAPPAWAPDGATIVFASGDAAAPRLVAIDPSTRALHPPLAEGLAGRPWFLPDGRLAVDGAKAATLFS